MAGILFLLLLSTIYTAQAEQGYANISLGSSISPASNSSWPSGSGLFAFGFYEQAKGYGIGVFLAGIPQKTVVWTANRDNPPVSKDVELLLTTDGTFALLSAQGQEVTTFINLPRRASSASMLDSGNFVLYDSDGGVLWQSFDTPTNTLLQGQHLLSGTELVSSASDTDDSKGIFRLKMQKDGNLVQYPVQTSDTAPYAYWASNTDGKGDNVTFHLENDGFLYLVNSTGSYINNFTSGGYSTKNTFYLLKIDVDGIFRLYSYNLDRNGNQSVLWASSPNKCDPKGLCGLNGFCVLNDREAVCKCLPGFASVEVGNWGLGCERNFTGASCKSKNGSSSTEYNTIQEVENTVWESDAYYDQQILAREDCKKACMEDCNCEAAMFDDGNCRKQRLPLRFGKRDMSSSNVALIKVSTSISTNSSTSSNTNTSEGTKSKREPQKGILIASIAIAAFGFLMVSISLISMYKTRVWAYKRISRDVNTMPRSFTYAELEELTNGFKDEIGRGAYGTVYRGTTSDKLKSIAVKKLHNILTEGEREFNTEIKVIGKTHHRNLVPFLGYCLDGPHRLLVYEYMSNGSLADLLYRPADDRIVWDGRIEIARNIAKGILYLHEECETQIIHCDIKPQNILMNENMCAKIADFGLSKLLKPDQTRTFTGMRGTRGYMAPEWHKKLAITVKADVYSFGVVLMEIIACRKCVDSRLSENEVVLEAWVYECFESGEVDKLFGGNEEHVEKRELERIVKIAIWCIQDEPSLRPTMRKVVLMLEGTIDVPVPPCPVSFLSSI